MKKPLVSIIIPTYKRPEKLEISIESCLNQTYDNIEIVVVDDNNPNTEERKNTEKYMKKYEINKKIIYLKQPINAGGAEARNAGIKQAKGDYITFLDDDDEYLLTKVEHQLNYMLENDYDMTFANLIMSYDDLKIKQEQRYKKDFELTKKGILTKHLVNVISGTPTFMFKKGVLLDINGFYDIPANQEYILMLKTIVNGHKIGYLDEVGVIAHIHSNEVRISNSKKIIDAKIKVVELIKPHLNLINYRDQRKTLYRLYSFIFFQSLKRKDKRAIIYGLKLIPYLDMVIRQLFNRKPITESKILYR